MSIGAGVMPTVDHHEGPFFFFELQVPPSGSTHRGRRDALPAIGLASALLAARVTASLFGFSTTTTSPPLQDSLFF